MLEHQALWLGPSSAAPRQDHLPSTVPPLYVILDPATRGFLGLARRKLHSPAWFAYLARPTLEVFESNDESLLFTLMRTWGGGLISDADGHRIGTFRGNLIRDRHGNRLALLDQSSTASAGRWLTPLGEELGTFAAADGGVLVNFSPTADNPFVKMMLLATLLKMD